MLTVKLKGWKSENSDTQTQNQNIKETVELYCLLAERSLKKKKKKKW